MVGEDQFGDVHPTSVVHAGVMDEAVAALAEAVASGDVMVLTGAGISTDSGIPDYRGPSGALRRNTPMTYQVFTGDESARRRYWARSYLGWGRIAAATPNTGHRAVTELQRFGLVSGIVTQNVDGLHQLAGATGVIDLHGTLDRVICLDCGDVTARRDLDGRLREANPELRVSAFDANPDGDADVGDDAVAGFRLVDCARCGSDLLKPDVVFFGENVPRHRVDGSYQLLASSGLLLVLGSSLTVMSGHRFVLRAAEQGVAVMIVNRGTTRGTPYAALHLDAPLGPTLTTLVDMLGAAAGYQAEGA
jgi:NAD-dependent SIR2 family protein deacetylase